MHALRPLDYFVSQSYAEANKVITALGLARAGALSYYQKPYYASTFLIMTSRRMNYCLK